MISGPELPIPVLHDPRVVTEPRVKELRQTLKELICDALELEDVLPSDIGDESPLFGDGLGLDSVDALELAIEIEKRHGVKITQQETDRAAFASVAALAQFLEKRVVPSASGQ